MKLHLLILLLSFSLWGKNPNHHQIKTQLSSTDVASLKIFTDLYNKETKDHKVTVISKYPLSEEQAKRLITGIAVEHTRPYTQNR